MMRLISTASAMLWKVWVSVFSLTGSSLVPATSALGGLPWKLVTKLPLMLLVQVSALWWRKPRAVQHRLLVTPSLTTSTKRQRQALVSRPLRLLKLKPVHRLRQKLPLKGPLRQRLHQKHRVPVTASL
jgi:hypothetical protein